MEEVTYWCGMLSFVSKADGALSAELRKQGNKGLCELYIHQREKW